LALAIGCAAVVLGLVIAVHADRGTTPAGVDAPVVEARPLIDPRTSAERFHHRIGAPPAGDARVDPRQAGAASTPTYIHQRGQGYVAP